MKKEASAHAIPPLHHTPEASSQVIWLQHGYVHYLGCHASTGMKVSPGTRTQQDTRAFGLLASVIETCRKRKVMPWPNLAKVIAERRKGNPVPSLPAMALVAYEI